MNHLSLKTFIMIATLSLNQVAGAASLWMSEADLRKSFQGHDIEGTYSNGNRFFESYHPDCSLTYIEPGKRNTGRWSITANTFCTIYDTDTSGGCFNVKKVGSNCFEFYFIARTQKQAANPKDGQKPAWTARAWLRNKEKTCQDESYV